MPDDEPGDSVEQHPVEQRSSSAPADPPPSLDSPGVRRAQSLPEQSMATEIHGLKDRISGAEKWMIWLTGGIVFLTAGIVIVGVLQWNAMSGQLAEMKSGGKDTHDLAVAAGKQADRTKELADRMKDQADQTKVIADQAVIQAGTGKRAAQTAVDTLGSTQKTFRAEQRAWLGINALTVVQFVKDKSLRIDIGFFNSGRTPALKVSDGSKYIVSNTFVTGPASTWPMNFLLEPQQSVPPQGGFARHIEMAQTVFGPQYDDIKAGKKILYFFGQTTYTDTSETVNGVTQFCIFLRMVDDKPDLAFCSTFNDLK